VFPLTILTTLFFLIFMVVLAETTLFLGLHDTYICRGCHGRDRMVVGFTTTCAITITTKVVSSNPVHGDVYSMQHYVIKFVSDLQQVFS
jgi:hypothetical protein